MGMNFSLILLFSALFFGGVHSQGYALQHRFVFYVSDGHIYMTYGATLDFFGPFNVQNLPLNPSTELAAASISPRAKSGVFLVYQDIKGNIIQTYSRNLGLSWSSQTVIVPAGTPSDSALPGTYLAYTILPTTLNHYVFWQDTSSRVRLAYYNDANSTWLVVKSEDFGFWAPFKAPLTAFSSNLPVVRVYFQHLDKGIIEIVGGGEPISFQSHRVAQFTETIKKMAGVYTQGGDGIDIYYTPYEANVIRDIAFPSWGLVGTPTILENCLNSGGFAAITDLTYVYLYVQDEATHCIREIFVGRGYVSDPRHSTPFALPGGPTPIAATII